MVFIREDGSLCQLLALRAEPRSRTFADARCSQLLWAFVPRLAALACRWQRLRLQCAGNSRFELTQVTEHGLNQLMVNDPKQTSHLNLRSLWFKAILTVFRVIKLSVKSRKGLDLPLGMKSLLSTVYGIVICLSKFLSEHKCQKKLTLKNCHKICIILKKHCVYIPTFLLKYSPEMYILSLCTHPHFVSFLCSTQKEIF